MTEHIGDRHPSRPLLVESAPLGQPFVGRGGGSAKVSLPGPVRQSVRLGARIDRTVGDLADGRISFDAGFATVDPERIVVFETIDLRTDISRVAARIGLDLVLEMDGELAPDSDFQRVNKNGEPTGNKDPVGACFHATCVSQEAAANIIGLWNQWQDTRRVRYGFGAMRQLFDHLHDVRLWSVKDRLRLSGLDNRLNDILPDQSLAVTIELWYRTSASRRQLAVESITELVERANGTVVAVSDIASIAYLALTARLPVRTLQALQAGNYDLNLVRSSDILFFTSRGQTTSPSTSAPVEISVDSFTGQPYPSGPALVALIDGAPLTNHRALQGRVLMVDPSGISELDSYSAELRHHGTAMASVLTWGDLNLPNSPAHAPIVARPVLVPRLNNEELPDERLIPDLMWEVFRDLFESPDVASLADITIVNISLGDPAMPFNVYPSGWARSIDWLSNQYGVLVVVSAGNHACLTVPDRDYKQLRDLRGAERAKAIRSAVASDALNRRLLSPAEAINALTVASLSADGHPGVQSDSLFDPSDGELMVSPASAIGGGYRRSVKPELAAPGGRQLFRAPLQLGQPVRLVAAPQTSTGPGFKVAAPSTSGGSGLVHMSGTSVSTAMVSRYAAELANVLKRESPSELDRRSVAVGVKALLVHSCAVPTSTADPLGDERVMGYGALTRDLTVGCGSNEITILFIGDLGASELATLKVPLPNGLERPGVKEVEASLAWLTPINSAHRNYRCAKLTFDKPAGLVESSRIRLNGVANDSTRRGTVQHQVYRTTSASASGQGSDLALTVRCEEQAGGLHGRRVRFAVAVSLRVGAQLGVSVYDQVAEQVRSRVRAAS